MLPPTGPAVGMLPEIPFTAHSMTLGLGECLLILTDGVTESRAHDGRLFGDDATDALLRVQASSAESLLDRVMASVAQHAGDTLASDDITLLAVRRSE
jgi:sigma-B regulation protein RsbU (phosphoserine phosphatase)